MERIEKKLSVLSGLDFKASNFKAFRIDRQKTEVLTVVKMPDNEREMWKRAYAIQEQSLDMQMTAEGFLSLLKELERAIMDFDRHPLMIHLAVMIYDYADVRYQQSLPQKEVEAER